MAGETKRSTQLEPAEVAAEEVTLGDAVGKGGFGTVYRATWKRNSGAMAVKAFTDEKFALEERDVIVRVMHSLKQPSEFIVPLLGVCTAKKWLIYPFLPHGDLSAVLPTM